MLLPMPEQLGWFPCFDESRQFLPKWRESLQLSSHWSVTKRYNKASKYWIKFYSKSKLVGGLAKMKVRKWFMLLLMFVLCIPTMGISVQAAQTSSGISIYLDGQPIKSDVAPSHIHKINKNISLKKAGEVDTFKKKKFRLNMFERPKSKKCL